jgi:hypothetical protein
MDTQKFTGKQLFIIVAVSVGVNVISGLIIYYLTKPKTTDPATAPPVAAKQGTTPTVTTVTTPTTTSEG